MENGEKNMSAYRAPRATRSGLRPRGGAPRGGGSQIPAQRLSTTKARGSHSEPQSHDTHQRRLGVLAQLVLLRALGDVLARLERTRLASAVSCMNDPYRRAIRQCIRIPFQSFLQSEEC